MIHFGDHANKKIITGGGIPGHACSAHRKLIVGGWMAFFLFAGAALALLAGFPVAFTLPGVALIFAALGVLTGSFDIVFLEAFPNRVFGIMGNATLIAVPVFVFMGIMLERSKLADQLLQALASLMRGLPGGLGIAVMLVGALLAASTGIVGATVVTMGVLTLPTMLKQGYRPSVASGTICAAGTLGQVIPPSIVLVLLGDVLSNAYQQAQTSMGIFSPETVSVGELFAGSLVPGLMLVLAYMAYIIVLAWFKPAWLPGHERTPDNTYTMRQTLGLLLGPLALIVSVLGSIMAGIATPTEAAAVGAVGAMILAAQQKQLSLDTVRIVSQKTLQISAMVFMILIGATLFSLVFRGFGGDDAVQSLLMNLPGGRFSAMLLVMAVMFLLGFILDFIEITFVVVPIVGPVLLAMGLDPVWLGVMIAVNLQTSFLTPPFGFSLFYFRSVAPETVSTPQIYRGVLPFIAIQVGILVMLALWPALATWLPEQVFS